MIKTLSLNHILPFELKALFLTQLGVPLNCLFVDSVFSILEIDAISTFLSRPNESVNKLATGIDAPHLLIGLISFF